MSDWRTILIVSLAPIVSAFGALWIRAHVEDRARMDERRWGAYQHIAAASEIIAVRSAVYNSSRSPRSAMGDSLQTTIKFLLVLVLSWVRPYRNDLYRLKLFADTLPTPEEPKHVMDGSELLDAMDDLGRARVEVHLVGSDAAIRLADELLDRSKEFLEAAESWQRSLKTGWGAGPIAEPQRQRMLEAHHAFLSQVRQESKGIKRAKGRPIDPAATST